MANEPYALVGTVEDCNGVKVNIGIDVEGDLILSGVLIRTIRLGGVQRDQFQHLFMEAERALEREDAELEWRRDQQAEAVARAVTPGQVTP